MNQNPKLLKTEVLMQRVNELSNANGLISKSETQSEELLCTSISITQK